MTSEKFSNFPLDNRQIRATLCVEGSKTLSKAGVAAVTGDDLRAYNSQTPCVLAASRVLAHESASGVTLDTFLTPSRSRLFCTGLKKPGKAEKSSSIGGVSWTNAPLHSPAVTRWS